MKFDRRVAVQGLYGPAMYHVHAIKARELVLTGQAERVDDKNIRLTSGLSSMPHDARDSQNSNITTRKQRMETGSVLIQHKHWHPALADFFRAQTVAA